MFHSYTLDFFIFMKFFKKICFKKKEFGLFSCICIVEGYIFFLERSRNLKKSSILDSLGSDIIFKEIFGTEKNIRFTELLLETLKNMPHGSLKDKVTILNSSPLNKTNIQNKSVSADILVSMGALMRKTLQKVKYISLGLMLLIYQLEKNLPNNILLFNIIYA